MSVPVTSKVVLNNAASSALLALAHREKLLTECSRADFCLTRVAERKYPAWLVAQALQQVVLFEQVYITKWLPWVGIHGDLVESGPFVPVENMAEPVGKIHSINASLIHGILKAQGFSPTPIEDPKILERTHSALQKIREWELQHGESSPDPLKIAILESLDPFRKTAPKYLEYKRIDAELDEFRPTAKALNEYLSVVATARERFAHVMTPMIEADNDFAVRPALLESDVNMPTALLKFTSSMLGVIPYGSSLADTLVLAKDPATIALRVKIQEWVDSLIVNSGASTEKIQKEIIKALSVLRAANVAAKVGTVTTYLGVPLALAGELSAFAAAMGWSCTIAGSMAQLASDTARKHYLWSSFGSSSRI